MTTVRHVLENKGHEVYAVRPNDTVADALRVMAENDVGSVLVMDEGSLVGIFTERRYAREVFLKGRTSPTTHVGEVMARDVIYVDPDQTVEACMALMTARRVRHLPVLRNGVVVGIISIGDLLKSALADREFNIEQLVLYVGGIAR